MPLGRSEKARPTPRLECNNPFNANTTRFHLHTDMWIRLGAVVWLDNHNVFMVMMLVMFMMLGVLVVFVTMVVVAFVALAVIIMLGMFLMMTAMPWRPGRGG